VSSSQANELGSSLVLEHLGEPALVLVDGIPINDPLQGYVRWIRGMVGRYHRERVARAQERYEVRGQQEDAICDPTLWTPRFVTNGRERTRNRREPAKGNQRGER
jgi:hypothetical protein